MTDNITATGEMLMKRRAAVTITWLELSGYDDDSVAKADAWVDSPEGIAALAAGQSMIIDGLGSYLGEALIDRYGGKWSFGASTSPQVVTHLGSQTQISNPFGKAYKRVNAGPAENLLAFVRLPAHMADTGGSAPPSPSRGSAATEWKGNASPRTGPDPLRLLAWGAGMVAAAVGSAYLFDMHSMLAMIWVSLLFVGGLSFAAAAAIIALVRRA